MLRHVRRSSAPGCSAVPLFSLQYCFIFVSNRLLLRKPASLLLLLFSITASAQYWQQEVNYQINVSLADREHSLKGEAIIEYINNSPDTLHFIWFHLWPNAYKNDKTAFTDQMLENGSTKFYFSGEDDKGYINRLDFKVNGATAALEDHPQHIDIIKVLLPDPLPPGKRTTITTTFNTRLPLNVSRGGHEGNNYQATQWYPKPAVYDREGWHPVTYLDQGEFYSEFGSFDVRITVPVAYKVASTGILQREDSSNEIRMLHYKQDHIHDFAWFANKDFIVNRDTCRLPSGRVINVHSYYTQPEEKNWKRSLQFAKDAVRHYSSFVGEYPYDALTVVQGPESFGGGMEYPMITVLSPMKDEGQVDRTIAHEVGHNWFYGILASNERAHPWMDEGMTEYYNGIYVQSKYRNHTEGENIIFETQAATKTDQPISTHSEAFSEMNYYSTAYFKAAEWLRYLESVVGREKLHSAMRAYYEEWKFRHPRPADFQASIEKNTGMDLDTVFAYLDKTGTLPNQERNGTRAAFVFDMKAMKDLAEKRYKEFIVIGPQLGFNYYDKAMLGLFVTNYKLPPSPFRFFLAPMYGTGSGELVGLGSISYTFYPKGNIRNVRLHLDAWRFNVDDFKTGDQPKISLSTTRLSPDLRFTFRNKNARSTFNRYIKIKSFFFNEESLSFFRDTTVVGNDTTITNKYRSRSSERDLHQLSFVIENNRVLYPYRGELKLEAGEHFAKLGFTGNYFFNYPKGGGLDLRLFAGKFIYTSSKTLAKQFATDRYHLNLTGPNGYEDYTYSDYFIGRNEFEGFASQQIMMRDGAFKVRTDLLASKVGRTDDWLAALNLSSTIPDGLNPLSMLPFKIPLKVFADIGTYAETWEPEAESDRFLFDAGLQVSLFFNRVNIYLPLVYSDVYKDYIQSTIEKRGRLWKKISFSIDIANFHPRQIDRRFSF